MTSPNRTGEEDFEKFTRTHLLLPAQPVLARPGEESLQALYVCCLAAGGGLPGGTG